MELENIVDEEMLTVEDVNEMLAHNRIKAEPDRQSEIV